MHRRTRYRALLVGPFPPPIGGDTILTAALASSHYWGDNGIEVESLNTSAGDKVRLPDEPLGIGDVTRGVRVAFLAGNKMRSKDVVLLWCNNRFAVTAGLAIVALSVFLRKPIFVKVFGAYLAKRISSLSLPWRKCAVAILGRAQYILAETKELAKELEEYFPAERIVFLPNYVSSGVEVLSKFDRPFTGRCVFFGQVKEEKGVFDIIDALKGAEGFSCDFFGPIVARDKSRFIYAISKHRNLAYRGIAEPGTVISKAAEYDVLLLPTYHPSEGYPAVILEAYAAGLPVIATRWRAIPEVVLHGHTGLLIPIKSPDSIIDALEKLKSDQALYLALKRNAMDYSRKYSEDEVIGSILFPHLMEVIGRSRRFRE